MILAVSDDLTEAIEFSLGKDVRTSKEADVIVTIDWNQETRKLQRRSTDRTPPEDIYIKYELEVAHVSRAPLDTHRGRILRTD